MPLYEYHCQKCDFTDEDLRLIKKRDEPMICVFCGKFMQRLIGRGKLFNLKGDWWFKKGLQ